MFVVVAKPTNYTVFLSARVVHSVHLSIAHAQSPHAHSAPAIPPPNVNMRNRTELVTTTLPGSENEEEEEEVDSEEDWKPEKKVRMRLCPSLCVRACSV